MSQDKPFEEFLTTLPDQPTIDCETVHPVVQHALDYWDTIDVDDFEGPSALLDYVRGEGKVTQLQVQIMGCTLGALSDELTAAFILGILTGKLDASFIEKAILRAMSAAFTAENIWDEKYG